MNRRLAFAIFAVVVLGIGTVVYLRQGGGLQRDIPVISDILDKDEPTATAPSTPAPAAFNKSAQSINDPTSRWVVVNKQRPLSPLTYTPSDLVSVGSGQQMRSEAAGALSKLRAAATTQNLTINPLSGYRSYARQQTVYQNEVNTYGQAQADRESAKPGYSEHQSGWGIDVGGGGCGIEDCFGNTAEGKWLAANAYLYGFIIRYPNGKESVTGYRYEPWHIRYIGIDLSTEMHNQNVTTLEEFFDL
jgi:D-alanyl-D-alanine carboxypeptidase